MHFRGRCLPALSFCLAVLAGLGAGVAPAFAQWSQSRSLDSSGDRGTVADCAGVVDNLFASANCGFDSNIVGWADLTGTGTHEAQEGNPTLGSLRVVPEIDGDGDRAMAVRSPCVPIAPLASYEVDGQFKIAEPANTVTCEYFVAGYSTVDCTGSPSGRDSGSTDIAGGAWTSLTTNFVSEPDASSLDFFLNCYDHPVDPAFTVLLDNFIVIEQARVTESPPPFIRQWGGPADFNRPSATTVDVVGTIYVADSLNHRIRKYTTSGAYISEWGSFGSADGGLNFPVGLAFDPSSGDLLVADVRNDRIQRFTTDGAFVSSWGTSGSAVGELDAPVGLVFDASGDLYITDNNNHRVQKFTTTGTYLDSWGQAGSGDGEFLDPVGIALDSGGNVYVTDEQNNRVQKFTSQGVFIAKWGSPGSGFGQFFGTSAVAVSSQDDIYVVDVFNDRIQKFDSDGMFLTTWGTRGSLDGQFNQPRGLSLDPLGNVIVTSWGNHRIQKFGLGVFGDGFEGGTSAWSGVTGGGP